MRQLEATLKGRNGFVVADHIHHAAASHCFSSRTWQPTHPALNLANAATVLVIFLFPVSPPGTSNTESILKLKSGMSKSDTDSS